MEASPQVRRQQSSQTQSWRSLTMMRYAGRPQVPPGTPQGEAVLGYDAAYEPVCHCVAEGLFLGAEEAALRPIGELRELGIGAIVNCTKEGTGGTQCAHETEGVAYCRVDCHDNEGADILSFLATTAEWIATHRAVGTAVLVHCQMGVSSSSTVAIAAIMLANGCSRDDAYVRVKEARRCIDPNRSFWKQLAQFEEELALRQRGTGATRDDTEPVVDSSQVTWCAKGALAAYSHSGTVQMYRGKIGTLLAHPVDSEVTLRWMDGSKSGFVRTVDLTPADASDLEAAKQKAFAAEELKTKALESSRKVSLGGWTRAGQGWDLYLASGEVAAEPQPEPAGVASSDSATWMGDDITQELPNEVLVCICAFLRPQDLGRLACTSRSFGCATTWHNGSTDAIKKRSVVEEAARRWVVARLAKGATPAAYYIESNNSIRRTSSWLRQMHTVIEAPRRRAAELVRKRVQWAQDQKDYDDHMMAGQYDKWFPVTHWFDEAQAFTDKDGFISKHGQELYDAVLLLKSANAL